MGKLENRVAVITGGNSGIGLAMARLFAAEVAKVVITGRRQQAIDNALREIGPDAVGVRGDIGKLADLDRLTAEVKRRFGAIDVYVADAGLQTRSRWGVGGAEELARASLFLATDDSSFVTGIELCVDGGMAQVSLVQDGGSFTRTTRPGCTRVRS